jgi:hypothetical protein
VAVGAPSLYLVGPLSVFPSSVGLTSGHARLQSPLRAAVLLVASRVPTYGRLYLSLYPLCKFSRSLEAGPYPGQPSSRHWQVARTWDPVSPPDFRFVVGFLLGFALGNPVVDLVRRARERVSVLPPDFCHVVSLLLGLALGAQVVDLARRAVSRN